MYTSISGPAKTCRHSGIDRRIRVESKPNQGSVFRVLLPTDLDAQIDPSATANDKLQMRSMFPGG